MRFLAGLEYVQAQGCLDKLPHVFFIELVCGARLVFTTNYDKKHIPQYEMVCPDQKSKFET